MCYIPNDFILEEKEMKLDFMEDKEEKLTINSEDLIPLSELGVEVAIIPKGYESLAKVFNDAVDQAAKGKGVERHGKEGQSFEDQPILMIPKAIGSNHSCIGQAVKKSLESTRFEPTKAIHELLGAINYLGAAVIYLRDGLKEVKYGNNERN